MRLLIDVNVLLALMHARHVHSSRAIKWLESINSENSICICRVVQMGLLRLLTRKSIMKDDIISASQFWKAWKALMADYRFSFISEPENIELTWKKTTDNFRKGQSAETDSYLASFAIAADLSLISFDKGFSKFDELKWTLLK